MATTVKLLALVAAGASAFSSCAIPSFSWMMLDGGAGSSMAYALATVGSNIYMGGHTTGTFSLTGTGTSGTTVEFVDADGTTDVYVAQVNTAGQPVAINSIASGSTSGGSRFGLIMDIQGLGSSHLVVTGYWKSGNLTFNNGQILQNPRSVSNSFVAKVVAATGSVDWVTHVVNEREVKTNGIDAYLADDGHYVVVAGGYYHTVDNSATAVDGVYPDKSNGMIKGFNGTTGTEIWSHILPGISSFGAVRMNDAGTFVAGTLSSPTAPATSGSAVIGGAAGTVTAPTGVTGSSAVVIKLATLTGVPVWAGSYGGGASGFDLALSADGASFFLAGGADEAYTVSTTMATTGSKRGILAKGATVDGAVNWAVDVPYLRGVKVNPSGTSVFFMSGAIMSTTTLDSLTLRIRGSSDVIIGSVSATDGTGEWAVDLGGTSMEYPWGFAIDASGDLFASGLTMSSSLTFGHMTHTKPSGAGSSAAYVVKLNSNNIQYPACVTACATVGGVSTPTVTAGNCYIENNCYATNAINPFSGQGCMACKAASQTAWTGPNLTAHCFVSGTCYTNGASMPSPPASGGYGRRLADESMANVNAMDEEQMIARTLMDEFALKAAKVSHKRELYGYGPPPPPTCYQCTVANWTTGWSAKTAFDYDASTSTCNGDINSYRTVTAPEMMTSSQVATVKTALGAVTGSDFAAVQTAYTAARPPPAPAPAPSGGSSSGSSYGRRLQAATIPAHSLKGLAAATYANCPRWVMYNAFYTNASSPFGTPTFTNFLDGFVQAAIDGTGAFAGLTTDAGRVEAVEKGVADQLSTMMALCSLAGTAKDTAANWDLAYAYYHGDTPARAIYGRANKRCQNYGTCLIDGTTAKANQHMLAALVAGRAGAVAGDAAITAAQYQIFESQMMIVYYQAALRYAYKLDLDVAASDNTRGNDHQGEGWAFWRVVEPYVVGKVAHMGPDYREALFTTRFYNTENPIVGENHYCGLKNLLESNLPVGTTITDMGALAAASAVVCPTTYVARAHDSPPPSMPHPPPAPVFAEGAATVTVHKTVVAFFAAGTPEDYSATVRDTLANNFATLAGVARDAVTVTITAGSVVVNVEIAVDDAAAATALTTTITTTMADTSTASAFTGMTVTSVPTVTAVADTQLAPASGPDSGLIIGIVVGVVVVVAIVIVAAVMMSKKKNGASAKTGA